MREHLGEGSYDNEFLHKIRAQTSFVNTNLILISKVYILNLVLSSTFVIEFGIKVCVGTPLTMDHYSSTLWYVVLFHYFELLRPIAIHSKHWQIHLLVILPISLYHSLAMGCNHYLETGGQSPRIHFTGFESRFFAWRRGDHSTTFTFGTQAFQALISRFVSLVQC